MQAAAEAVEAEHRQRAEDARAAAVAETALLAGTWVRPASGVRLEIATSGTTWEVTRVFLEDGAEWPITYREGGDPVKFEVEPPHGPAFVQITVYKLIEGKLSVWFQTPDRGTPEMWVRAE